MMETSRLTHQSRSNERCSSKCSILMSLVLIASIFILLVAVLKWNMDILEKGDDDQGCHSKECEEVLEVMNTSVDPCSDFYSYACGNWIKKNPSNQNLSHWTNFVRKEIKTSKLDRQNLHLIKNVLEGKSRHTYKYKWMKKLKKYFRQCRRRDDEELKTTQKFVRKLLKHIPLKLKTDNKTHRKNLAKLLANVFSNFGVNTFFRLYIGINDRNSTEHIIKVDQPTFTFPDRENYNRRNQSHKAKDKHILEEYMRVILQLIYDKEPSSEELKGVIEFEYQLGAAELTLSQHRQFEHKAKLFSLKQLEEKFKFIDWNVFLQSIFNDREVTSKDVNVIVTAPSYLEKVTKIINQTFHAKHGLEVLENWLKWRVIDSLVPLFTLPFRQARTDLVNKLLGLKSRSLQKVTWKNCLKAAEKKFKYAIGHLYVNEVQSRENNENDIANVKGLFQNYVAMIGRIKKALDKIITNSNWMDNITKQKAIQKSSQIKPMVGYPDVVLDLKKLDKMYGHISEYSTYYESLLADIKKQHTPGKLFSKLRKPVTKQSWMSSPVTINAYYTAVMNEIILPLGILQAPFFNSKRSEVLNYGGIGFSIGHELSHAFDDNGRKYNGGGDLESWWTADTLEKYKEHTECLVAQYNNISLGGHFINGRNTLGENIADNGGLKAAYQAYFGEDEELRHKQPISGLNFTSEQLFFISFGQVWCSHNSVEYEVNKMKTNPHPPSSSRVMATMGNSMEFSEAFHCPAQSKLNPAKKCSVW